MLQLKMILLFSGDRYFRKFMVLYSTLNPTGQCNKFPSLSREEMFNTAHILTTKNLTLDCKSKLTSEKFVGFLRSRILVSYI